MANINVRFNPQAGTHDPIDYIYGTGGADVIYGGFGQADPADFTDYIYGYGGNDRIYANAGADYVRGADGNDSIWGGAGNDIIHGDAGNDTLFGSEGSDTIYGGIGDDVICGGVASTDPNDGPDEIYGGEGRDMIYANGGNDLITAGPGADDVWGGNGADVFRFNEVWSSYWQGSRQYATVTRDSNSQASDRIYGFERGDRLDLRGIDGDVSDRYDTYTAPSGSVALLTGNDDNDTLIAGRTLLWGVTGGNTIVYTTAGFSVTLVGYTGALSTSDFILA